MRLDARTARAKLDEAIAVRSEALDPYNPQGALEGAASEIDTQTIGTAPVINLGSAGSIPLTNTGTVNQESLNFNVSWEVDLFAVVPPRGGSTWPTADLAAARFDYEATRTSLERQRRQPAVPGAGLGHSARRRQGGSEHRGRSGQGGAWCESRSRPRRCCLTADQAAIQAGSVQRPGREPGEPAAHRLGARLLVLVGARRRSARTRLPAAGRKPARRRRSRRPSLGELLARRPDVRETAADLRSATGQLKLDELALFPKFTLTPGVGLDLDALSSGPASTSVALDDRRRLGPAGPRHAAAQVRDPRARGSRGSGRDRR